MLSFEEEGAKLAAIPGMAPPPPAAFVPAGAAKAEPARADSRSQGARSVGSAGTAWVQRHSSRSSNSSSRS